MPITKREQLTKLHDPVETYLWNKQDDSSLVFLTCVLAILMDTVLYGSANDPRTASDPGPQMIPKLDRK